MTDSPEGSLTVWRCPECEYIFGPGEFDTYGERLSCPTHVRKLTLERIPVLPLSEIEPLVEAARETCRECQSPAEFIVWGKLFPSEALGPRCYDCAANQIGHHALARESGYAVFDLRPSLPRPNPEEGGE